MLRLPTRSVRLGFASELSPGAALDVREPLATGRDYYFWIELGRAPTLRAGPAGAGANARLDVALFGFGDELALFPGADVGEMQLEPDGSARVARQATQPLGLAADSPTLKRRLFFRISTPTGPLRARLRCNLYHQQTLVQSWLVQAQVGRPVPQARSIGERVRAIFRRPALIRWEADYILSRALQPAALGSLGGQRLSLLLNSGGPGTHTLRFFGADGQGTFKHDGEVPATVLQALLVGARKALKKASWGTVQEWQGEPYRYAGPVGREALTTDLVQLAICGFRAYHTLINPLAGNRVEVARLRELMRTPGNVQIALTSSAHLVLPTALLYDYFFDTDALPSSYRLCPAFEAALDDPAPLEASRCFQGDCPVRDADGNNTTICPSGFWGFRHALGLPMSTDYVDDAPALIEYDRGPTLAVSVSTDQTLTQRAAHEQALRALRPDLIWTYASDRDGTFKLLKDGHAQLVYFYCHGGLDRERNVPYLLVGPATERGITPDNLRAYRIEWETPRPLVFVNGCHTTEVEPERALEFVSAFVGHAGAAGVIGTEITIFEPLASTFGEQCLRRFLDGAAIGEAVRLARLAVLKTGNPLGLVYIPFTLPGLRLAAHTPSIAADAARTSPVVTG